MAALLKETLVLPESSSHTQSLSECARLAIDRYLDGLGELTPHDLHAMVLEQIERPLFTTVLARTRGNQSEAARMLGISRGTLRRRLANLGIAQTSR